MILAASVLSIYVTWQGKNVKLSVDGIEMLKHVALCTRWFKYDRDCLHLFTHKSVPVIFEPPCILYKEILL